MTKWELFYKKYEFEVLNRNFNLWVYSGRRKVKGVSGQLEEHLVTRFVFCN